METNQLGKSIEKAAWIIACALVVSMIIYYMGQQRYTPLGNASGYYIDQKTGIVRDVTK